MKNTFGARIKKARKEHNLSQDDLVNEINKFAKRKKITRGSIAMWESGMSKDISGSNLVIVAKILNITPEYIMWGDT